jgi:nicotinamidase-related amidase
MALSTPAWADMIPESDRQVFRAAGFGQPVGLGRRPALLVIDVQVRTVGSAPRPLLEAVKEYPSSCGEVGWRAIDPIAALLARFRQHAAPVIHACVARKSRHDAAGFGAKVPGVLAIDEAGYAFVSGVAPREDELVLPKAHASAFFATALASHLVRLGVDSLVVAGCTTSGCVRATVVDACSLNYRVLVCEDAVYDRGAISHAASLFDMANKYADVLPLESSLAAVDASLCGSGARE